MNRRSSHNAGAEAPDIDACRLLMERYGMLENIQRHSCMVARIAAMITDDLNRTMAEDIRPISRPLVIAGALLHDIGKTQCLNNNRDHARVGAEICTDLGFEEIADIVAHHVLLPVAECHSDTQHAFHEREIVYYADKRVNHETIVDLDERLDYILGRYGRGDTHLASLIKKNFSRCSRLEQKIFMRLSYGPAALADRVHQRASLSFFLAPA